MKITEKQTGLLGLLSVLTLLAALLVFGFLNSDFSFSQDLISKLGAKGEPNALGFNLIGFVAVGAILVLFGLSYGRSLNDKLLSILLSLFGIGFAFTAIPFDFQTDKAAVSKAHTVAICLGLAFWLFGLARLGYNRKLKQSVRNRANITAIILVLSMVGFVFELWSMPITHRLVFLVVFGWTTVTSIELIYNEKTTRNKG